MSKIIQSGRFIVALLSKLASPFMKVSVLLVNIFLASLAKTSASAINGAIQRKKYGRGVVRAGEGITFCHFK